MSKSPADDRKPNHLAGQTSPYLLQHVFNPVDWYPWGPEALERSKALDRPIFLSIGYAACHWCHVMERESFENPRIADYLNDNFVCIKVDREERPDLDEIYMAAVQLMTGSGGWPMSVFLTPDLKPFVGGTYFPPDDRYGRPGFLSVLRRVRGAWDERRDEIEKAGEELTRTVRSIGAGRTGDLNGARVGSLERARAVAELVRRFDGRWGGFGHAPKFPPHGALALLLREAQRTGDEIPRQMAELTLERMARGGMYDQIGGGFARYSVDEKWLAPHFEKMLYDQALLVPVYVDAWLLTRRSDLRSVVEDTLDFVRRELTAPEGGCYSSLDADSEGEEGRFYVWTPSEVRQVLGEQDAEQFCSIYGITQAGNFEGRSIPNLLDGSLSERARSEAIDENRLRQRLGPLRRRLLQARQQRVRPATDDKILTAWNGLMITAFARAYQALGRTEDLRSARHAAAFVGDRLLEGDRLKVSFRDGRVQLNGYLDDYAFMVRALVDLYEAVFDPAYLWQAARLARTMIDRFEDRQRGGFYFTSDDHEQLLVRTKSNHDGALPAGSGVACEALLRLALHLDDDELRVPALRTLSAYHAAVQHAPSAYASLLVAAELAQEPPLEIAVVGPLENDATRQLLATARARYLPNRIVALAGPQDDVSQLPLLAGKTLVDNRPAAYVCQAYHCEAPVTEPAALDRLLAQPGSRSHG